MPYSIYCFTFLIAFFIPQLLVAQTDTFELKYTISGDGAISTGNVEQFNVGGRSSVSTMSKYIGADLDQFYTYGEQRNIKVENDFANRLFVYFLKRKRLYFYLMNVEELSHRRDITFRMQNGGGIGYYLLRGHGQKVKLNLTLLHEQTEFKTAKFPIETGITSRFRKVWRANLRLKGTNVLLHKHLKLNYEGTYQPSLEDDRDYRFYWFLTMDWAIYKHLSFRTSINYTYENIVLIGKKQGDLRWTVGLAIGN